MSACRTCGAPIRWVRTWAEKLMPLDAKPDPAGNVTLERVDPDNAEPVRARVNAGAHLEELRAEGAELWMAHFATCKRWNK